MISVTTSYDVVESTSMTELVMTVRSRISCGWVPTGGIAILDNSYITRYYQALVFTQPLTKSA